MLKRLFFTLLFTICTYVYAQVDVTHAFICKEDVVELKFHVSKEPGWHVDPSLNIESIEGLKAVGGLETRDSVNFSQRFRITGQRYSVSGFLRYLACNDEMCLMPMSVEFAKQGVMDERKDETTEADVAAVDTVAPVKKDYKESELTKQALWMPVKDKIKQQGNEDSNDNGIAGIFLMGLIGGLLALLTPCIWPIIPLTISFFSKRKDGVRDTVVFGLSIILMFFLLGISVTLLFGDAAMNAIATSASFNVVCCVVLLLFGLSFMGLFELRLPSSWANRINDAADNKAGFVGIFLMAVTLVVVGFSCTAPILGTILVEIASQQASDSASGMSVSLFRPLAGMLGFAISLAMPFMLFAMFPQWMKRMPRSGEWMMHVKVLLGVLEIAFAMKFLSVADMAYGWGILPRTLFLTIWTLLFMALGVYLILKIKGTKRILLPVIPMLFAIYLLTGTLGMHNAVAVSAFAPPVEYENDGTEGAVFTDYEEGMRFAEKCGKPVFLEFTGYGCVNCRKMEAAVFTDERVRSILRERYVVIRLYVDDRTALAAHEKVSIDGKERILRTIGDKWSLLESYKFGSVAQPYYIILAADGTPLSEAYAYDENISRFLQFLAKTY